MPLAKLPLADRFWYCAIIRLPYTSTQWCINVGGLLPFYYILYQAAVIGILFRHERLLLLIQILCSFSLHIRQPGTDHGGILRWYGYLSLEAGEKRRWTATITTKEKRMTRKICRKAPSQRLMSNILISRRYKKQEMDLVKEVPPCAKYKTGSLWFSYGTIHCIGI